MVCTTGSSSGTSGGTSAGGAYATLALYDFPTGADLAPTDPCNLGSPSPAQPVIVGGNVWVTLSNLRPDFSIAGPSFLAELNATTGALSMFELAGCFNAQFMAASGTNLLVACTNDYFDPGEAVLFDTVGQTVTATFATGGAPTSVAISGSLGFFADALGSGVIVVDLTPASSNPVPYGTSAEAALCPTGDYVAGIATGPSSSNVLALCAQFGGQGLVLVLDGTGQPVLGSVEAVVDPGAGGINYLSTAAGSDTFAILVAGSNEVQYVQWPTNGQFLFGASTAIPSDSQATDVGSNATGAVVTLSGLDQVGLLDLTSSPPGLAALAQFPAGSDPYYAAAASTSDAWVTLLNTNQLAHVTFASNLDGGAFDGGPLPTDAGSDTTGFLLPDGGDPFVIGVVSYTVGANGGYGTAELPGIVEGPPQGGGASQGSLDVFSLGTRGVIIVEMGQEIVDGMGDDFTVFENAFDVSSGGTYAEPGAVAVSDDGGYFVEFPCDPDAGVIATCAGINPVYSSTSSGITPFDPSVSGGDTFDLATIGVTSARYVRIRDLGDGPPPQVSPTAGFDLDAIAVINAGP